MKVNLINPQEVENIFDKWGQVSSVCYDTDTTKVNPSAIGQHCMNSGHFSGSRASYILFKIEDCPRFVIDQCVRKEIGTVKNVQSFRYVTKDNFAYEIPRDIADIDELLHDYVRHMENTRRLYEQIHTALINAGKTNERASEQARYVLPMATQGTFVIGFTVESLIDYAHKRLCVRSEDVHREMAIQMVNLVKEVNPRLGEELVPQCRYLTWCPESKSCGKCSKKK